MSKVKLPRKRLEVYRAHDGWRFRAIAGNGRIIGASEEAVKQRAYAIRRAARQFPALPVAIIDAEGVIELLS